MTKSKAAFRARLRVSTVLTGGMLLVTTGARAQALPDTNNVTTQTNSGDLTTSPGTQPGFVSSANRLDIDLNDIRTIINWNAGGTGFNVGAGNTVDFNDNTGGPVTNIAVLNRDLSGTFSNIEGNLTSDANVAVYLINTNGILFGAGANVNVGALIAGTLDVTDTDFLNGDFALQDGDSAINFAGPGTSTTGITMSGGTINATGAAGGLGQLILIGAFVDAAGGTQSSVNGADRGDVAFIAGTDITVARAPSSPLSFTIAQGTQVSGAITASGNVAGRNVTLAFASQGTFTDALLIGSTGMVTATTASVTDRGVVLAAGTSASGVTVLPAGGSNDTGGTATIAVDGTVTASDGGTAANTADVEARALSGIAGAGAISAADAVNLSSVGNGVANSGSIQSGASTTISAPGAIAVRDIASTAGDISLSGAVVTLADADYDALAGNISVTGQTMATGSSTLDAGGASGTVTFNNAVDGAGSLAVTSVAGTTLSADVGAGAPLGSLTINGPATIGGTVVNTSGNQSYNGAVTLSGAGSSRIFTSTGAGAIDFAGALDGGYDVSVNTDGATRFGGAVGAASALASLTTDEDGTTAIDGGTTALTDTITTSGDQIFFDAVTLGADTVLAGGGGIVFGSTVDGPFALTVNTSGPTVFFDVVDGLASLTTDFGGTTAIAGGVITTSGNQSYNDTVELLDDTVLTSTGGSASFAAVDGRFQDGASNDLTLDFSGTIDIAGGFAEIGTLDATGAGIDFTGQTIAAGNITLDATTGALTGAVVNAAADMSGAGTAIDIGSASAGTGALSLTASSGDLTLGTGSAGTTAQLTTSAGAGDVVVTTSLSSGGAATVTSAADARLASVATTNGNLTVNASAGEVTGIGAGRANLSAGGATSNLSVTGGSLARLGTVGAGNGLSVTADAIDITSATAVGGALTLNADAGSLTLGTGSAGGAADLEATGDIAVTTRVSGESITVDAGGTLNAAELRGVTSVTASSGGDMTIGTAVADGPFVPDPMTANAPLGSLVTLTAGFDAGTGTYSSADLTISSLVDASGFVDLTAGRDVIVQAGAQVLSDNVVRVRAGDDILVRAGGAIRAAVSPQPDFTELNVAPAAAPTTTGVEGFVLRLNAGQLPLNYSPAAGNVASVIVDGAIAAPRRPLEIVGGAVQADANAIDARSIVVDIYGAPALTDTASDDGGQLRAECVAGNVCLGELSGAFRAIAIGTVGGINRPNDVRIDGGFDAIQVVIAANRDIYLGRDGAGSAITVSPTTLTGERGANVAGDYAFDLTAAAGSIFLRGDLDVTIGDGTSNAGQIARFVAGQDLVGPGARITGDRIIGFGIGGDLTLAALAAESLNTLDAAGATIAAGLLDVPGSITISDALTITGGDANIAAGGDVTIGDLLASDDIDVAADGDIAIDSSSGGDVAIDAVGAVNAGVIDATGLIDVEGDSVAVTSADAGTSLAIRALAAQLTLGAGVAGTTATLTKSGATGELQTSTLTSGGNATITSATNARLGTISGANVVVDAAAGEVTGIGTGARANLAANGAGSDVTVTGGSLALLGTVAAPDSITVTADLVDIASATATLGDLDLDASDDLVLGAGQGLDVALDAGGDITTGAVSARDDIVIRAAGTVATGALTAGTAVGGNPAVDAAGAGDALAGVTLGGNAVDISAAAVTVASANAGSQLAITATDGQLTLGTGQAGTTATLVKQGATGALQATTLASGHASSITSSTDARLGSVTGSSVSVSAVGGEVTGIGAGARANLTANGSGGDVAVTGGSLARLGTVSADDGISVTADSLDISSAAAINGALSLTADDGDLILGTGSAGGVASLATTGAAGDVTVTTSLESAGDASIASVADANLAIVRSTGGDVAIDAANTVSAGTIEAAGLIDVEGDSVAVTEADAGTSLAIDALGGQLTLGAGTAGTTATLTKAGATGELEAGTLTSGGAATIASSTDARLGTIAGSSVDVTASSGEVTGIGANARADLAAGGIGGDVTVTGGTLARLDEVVATDAVMVTADTIDVTSATAGGALALTADAGDLTLGTGSAGSTASLATTGGAGDIIVANSLVAVSDAAVDSVGDTDLALVRSTGGDVTIAAVGLAGAGTLEADGLIDVEGGSVAITDADAGTSLAIRALDGQLTLGAGTAGTTATLTKAGATGELQAGTLTSGGDATITSSTHARLGAIAGSSVDVTASSGEVTGIGANAGADLTANGAGGDVTVAGGTLAQLDDVTADDAITVTADRIDVTNATATNGALTLTADAGNLTLGTGSAGGTATLATTGGAGDVTVTTSLESVGDASIDSVADASLAIVRSTGGSVAIDVAGALDADTIEADGLIDVQGDSAAVTEADAGTSLAIRALDGGLTLGTGTAGTTATLTKAGASGELQAGTLTSGGHSIVTSSTNARLGQIIGASVSVATSSGEVTGIGANAGADLTANGAGGDVTVTGGTLARLDEVAATDAITVTADTIDVTSATAGGALALTADAGDLTLGTGNAGGTASLATTGGAGDVTVTTSLIATGDADIDAAGDTDLELVRSTAGDVTVDAAGLAAAATLESAGLIDVEGDSVAIASADAGTSLAIRALGGQLTLGTGDAGTTASLIKTGAIGELQATTLIAVGDATIMSATDARLGSVGAANVSVTAAEEATGIGAGARANLAANGAGNDVVVGAGTLALLGSVTAPDAVTVTAGAIDVTTATAGGALSLTADAGDVALGTGSAGTTATLDASDAVTISTGLTAAGLASVTAGGAATIASIASSGGDVQVSGASVLVTQASADDALALTATAGQLTLGTGSAGTTARLDKQGGAGELQATTLVSGGASTIDSATNARLGSVTGASVTVTASAGDVTGIGTGARANLAANGAGGDVTVTGGSSALLGTVAANDSITVTADTIDVTSATAANGNLSLTADNGDVIVGTGDAGGAVTIDATDAVSAGTIAAGGLIDLEGASVAVTSADAGTSLAVRALAGQLTLGTGDAGTTVALTKQGAAGDLRATTLRSGGNATIASSTDAVIGTLASGTNVAIDTVGATDAGTIEADGLIDIDSASATVDLADAGTSLAILARSAGLTLTTGIAGTTATLTKQGGAGVLAVTSLTSGGNAALVSSTSATLGTVTSGGGATVDSVGATDAGTIEAAGLIDVDGGSVDIGTADAGTSLTMLARAGQLTLGTGEAGANAALTKQGAAGELQVTNSLASAADAAVTSSTNARIANLTSAGGNVAVAAASGEVTGVGAGGRANIAAQADARDVTVVAGTLARLGTATAGNDLTVASGNAATPLGGSIDATSATARTGALALTAVNGDVRLGTGVAGTSANLSTTGTSGDVLVTTSLTSAGNATVAAADDTDLLLVRSTGGNISVTAADAADAGTLMAAGAIGVDGASNNIATATAGTSLVMLARTGQLTLGTGTAGTTATLTKQGATGALQATTLTSGGNATIASSTDTNLGTVTSTGANIEIDTVGATDADTLDASGSIGVDSGSAVIDTVDAGTTLRLLARAGQLALGTGTAGTTATLTKQGAMGALQTTTLTSGGDASITSSTDTSLATVTSTSADIEIDTAGITDAGTLDATGSIDVDSGGATIDLMDAGTSLTILARSGQLTLGTGTAGTTATLTKQGAVGALQATTLTSGGDATIASSTDTILGTVAAANIDIDTVGATDAGTLDAAGLIDVDSGSAAVDMADAGTSLALLARSGQLTLGTGTVGTTASLTKEGGTGALQISSDLTAGGDVSIASSTDARLANVTSVGGDVGIVAASGEVTGVGADGRANIAAQDDARDVTITAGTLARLGNAVAGNDLTVSAGDPTGPLAGSIDVTNAAARTGALALSAHQGDIRVGTGTAATTATLSTGGSGDIIVTTSLTSSDDTTISAADDTDLLLVRSASGDIAITAADAAIAGTVEAAGSLAVDGASLGFGNAAAGTSLTMLARTGALDLGTGVAGTTATLTKQGSDGALRATALTSADDATIASSTDAVLGSVQSNTASIQIDTAGSTQAGSLAAADLIDVDSGSAVIDTAGAGTSITALARAGQLTLGTGTAGTTATLTKQGSVGELQVTSSLTANGNAALTSATSQRLGTVTSRTGDVTLAATNGSITGIAAGADFGAADLSADGRVQLRAGQSGLVRLSDVAAARGDVDIEAGTTGAATSRVEIIDSVAAAGAYRVTGGSVALGGDGNAETQAAAGLVAVTATNGAITGGRGLTLQSNSNGTGGEALTLTANGNGGAILFDADSRILGGTGSDVTLDTVGTAAVGQVTAAGRTIAISANNVELQGASAADLAPRVTAQTVNLTNRGDIANATRLGDGPAGSAGFDLTQAEVNRISATGVTIESGVQNVEIGALALNASVGSARLNIQTVGRIDVTGTVTAEGSSDTRVVMLGGHAADAANQAGSRRASVIRVASTVPGGGRLLMGNANLDLRGAKIGVGQDAGLLASVGLTPGGTPSSFDNVVNSFIANPNSTLYVAATAYSAPTLLTANTLSVTYTDYALFQNTAQPLGVPTGAVIGAMAVNGVLNLGSSGTTGQNGFAIFGEITGRTGAEAALLGPSVIVLTEANPSNTRINGCVIGGGGCLVSSVAAPNTNIFDLSQLNILRSAEDLGIEFDPVIGTNNEALFSGLGSIDPDYEDIDCEADPSLPECSVSEEE